MAEPINLCPNCKNEIKQAELLAVPVVESTSRDNEKHLSQTTGEHKPTAELTRQELLNAIDFEIMQREGATAKHGINVWGIVAAAVTLSWTSVNKIAEQEHNWTSIALVLFASWLCLSHVVYFLTKRLGWTGTFQHKQGTNKTLRQAMLLSGADPDTLPYYVFETACAFGVSLYLIFKGFHLLGAVACVLQGVAFLCLILVWLMTRIKIPLTLRSNSPEQKIWHHAFIGLAWGLNISVILLAVGTVIGTWPSLGKENIGLGCILAAFATVLSFSLKYTRPPYGLPELRSLRSRVAFSLLDLSAARNEAENILMGPSRENYITSKADAVISILDERTRMCDILRSRMRRIISVDARLRAQASSESAMKEAAEEMGGLFNRVKSDFNLMASQLTTAKRLRTELDHRIRIARSLLDMPHEQLQAVLNQVEAAGKRNDAVSSDVAALMHEFFEAAKHLSELVKDQPTAKQNRTKLSELFADLYRN